MCVTVAAADRVTVEVFTEGGERVRKKTQEGLQKRGFQCQEKIQIVAVYFLADRRLVSPERGADESRLEKGGQHKMSLDHCL